MIHPDTEVRFINDEVGYGVVATKLIPKGTITWVQDDFDQEFTKEEFDKMSPHYQSVLKFYSFRNKKGNFVLCWDIGRFVNHSFKSNCLTTAYDFEVAIRDIQPGEQLTDDYGYLNIEEPFRGIDERTKRKVVYPNDLEKYHTVWDNQLKKVFPSLPKLQQPLGHLLSSDTWNKVNDIIEQKREMDSILSNLYPALKEAKWTAPKKQS